jgi:transposase-like protein
MNFGISVTLLFVGFETRFVHSLKHEGPIDSARFDFRKLRKYFSFSKKSWRVHTLRVMSQRNGNAV